MVLALDIGHSSERVKAIDKTKTSNKGTKKRDNFGPSSWSRFHTSDDSRIAEMGPGRLERPGGDEEPSVLPPRSRSDQVVQLWNRRCTREHHGKKWDFFVAESDEELESTSVFFQMNQFTFF